MQTHDVTDGCPDIRGARLEHDGTNFAVWAPHANTVSVSLFDSAGDEVTSIPLPARTEGVWHGKVIGVGHGQAYGLRVDGPREPASGSRFDGEAVLLDPYAKAVIGGFDGHTSVMRGVVVTDDFDWQGDQPPRTPWDRTVVYEAHVKGLTMLHPDVPDERRGTYAGVSDDAVLDHLVDLGITAIQLLPVHHFASEPSVTDRGLVNYWGYNSAGFFAPHAAYSSAGQHGQQVAEFKEMVRALHSRGIEVILDVVYNHTCEGDEDGPLTHLRGLDDRCYYRSEDGHYVDLTGCGNTLRSDAPPARRLVLDSLRHWVSEMHVDGFRFDLASALARDENHEVRLAGSLIEDIGADPVLSCVKLIAEPWDATTDGYLVGQFPPGWSEWNDKFRDTVRDFWRGHGDGVRKLASRLSGSSDLYRDSDRSPYASVNFVTAHDGFTLRDLVSYGEKHNEANGEGDRDGHGDNRSWNCGVEGETADPAVRTLRQRQASNIMGTLVLATGVPMLCAGDEHARTQDGNNNAYCQDNETSWLPWRADDGWEHLARFTRDVIAIRGDHAALRPEAFFTGQETNGSQHKDVSWWHPLGRQLNDDDWYDTSLQSLGMFVDGTDRPGDALLILLHAGPEPVDWALPGRERYDVLVDTSGKAGSEPVAERVGVSERSLVVLRTGR